MKGKLIVISAPSGCGKTTIVKKLLAAFKDIYFSISATTRTKRPNETDGKDYFFISKEDFDQKIAADEFVEWNEHFGNKYGTLKSNIIDKIESGIDVIFDVDVNGALNIKNVFPESYLIFILPPNREVLIERLRNRGTETEETLKIRLKRTEEELSKADKFDYRIINDVLEAAIKEITDLILIIKNK